MHELMLPIMEIKGLNSLVAEDSKSLQGFGLVLCELLCL